MKQIRSNVFETNSSSSHSLTINKDDLCPMPFPPEAIRDGVVYIYPGEFGWEWDRLDTLLSKLRYICTDQIRDWSVCGGDRLSSEARESNSLVDRVFSLVEAHTGVRLEMVDSDDSGYVDHESSGTSNDLNDLNDEDLLNFLLSKNSFIQLGNDNSEPPVMVYSEAEKEKVPFYANWYREPGNDWVMLKVKLSFDDDSVSIKLPKIRKLLKGCVDSDSPCAAVDLLKRGTVSTLAWTCVSSYNPTEYSSSLQSSVMRKLTNFGFFVTPSMTSSMDFTKVSWEDRRRQSTGVLEVWVSPEVLASLTELTK